MSCETAEIAANFIQQCGHSPKQGLQEAYFFHLKNVDDSATVTANRNTKVTTLTLKADKKIYSALGREISKANFSMVEKDFGVDAFLHGYELSIKYNGEDERERVQELIEAKGGIGVLVKKNDKGLTGELYYELLGLESGMKVKNFSWDSSANSGVATLVLGTKEGQEEATPPKIYQDTDLATTEAWVTTNLFVPV